MRQPSPAKANALKRLKKNFPYTNHGKESILDKIRKVISY
jgi:hypothetical protein